MSISSLLTRVMRLEGEQNKNPNPARGDVWITVRGGMPGHEERFRIGVDRYQGLEAPTNINATEPHMEVQQ